MKIAIVKPDHSVDGGFETVVGRLAAGLRERGHAVDVVFVDAGGSAVSHLPVAIDEADIAHFSDAFRYLNLIGRCEALDVSAYDAVLCTQPASFAVRHPAKVVLFYHHVRAFYDLREIIASVRVDDSDLFHLASLVIGDVDGFHLTSDVPVLAGSRRAKERLAQYSGLGDNVEVFYCGTDERFLDYRGPLAFESPLCVGRHEFPKRPELFLHAMHHLPGVPGRILGTGSYTDRLKGLDAWLQVLHLDANAACEIDDLWFWQRDAFEVPLQELESAAAVLATCGVASHVTFLGRLSQDALLQEYASALCVVCPAFDEDYGLTCVEAMACGKPVIACRDGGGYVELIDDGVDGVLVEPTGPAIAEAIRRFLDDRELARKMGERGREKARAFTWARAVDQAERALDRVYRAKR